MRKILPSTKTVKTGRSGSNADAGKAELDATKTQLDAAGAQITAGEKQLNDAQNQLDAAQKNWMKIRRRLISQNNS